MLYDEMYDYTRCFGVTKSKCDTEGTISQEEIDLSKIDISKKCVIILCGNNTKHVDKANLYAKNTLNWLQDYPNRPDVSVYSIYYPRRQPLNNDLRPNTNFNYNELIKTLYKKIFYRDNKLLSVDEIAKNLSNITFFGHSVGGHVMNELMYNFKKLMQHKGFSNEDINKICSSIVFVGYAPFEFVDAPTNNIYITPLHDSVGSTKLAFDRMQDHKDLQLSNPNVDIKKIIDNIGTYHYDFVDIYREATQNDELLLAQYDKSLAIIPELLYYDGIKEDHNLAGVVHYPGENPYKTPTGKRVTRLMGNIFNYILSTNRQNLSVNDIYRQAVSQTLKTTTETNKEL